MIALALVVALAGAPTPAPPTPPAPPAAPVAALPDVATTPKPAAPNAAVDAAANIDAAPDADDPDAAAERAAGALAGKIATGNLDANLGGTPIPVAAPSTTSSPTPATAPPPPPDLQPAQTLGMGELVGQLVKMLLMLGVVVALAYLTLNKGLGKLVERQNAGKRVKVVERVALDQKRSLYLVELDGQQMLLAGGEGGVVHLREVDPNASTTTAASKPITTTGFAATLKRGMAGSRAARDAIAAAGGEAPPSRPRAVAGDPPVTTGLANAAVEDKTA